METKLTKMEIEALATFKTLFDPAIHSSVVIRMIDGKLKYSVVDRCGKCPSNGLELGPMDQPIGGPY